MARRFDLVVLGTGPAGSGVARRCAEAGRRVAIVDRREPGGTCALRGCNPKKVLVHAAELIGRARATDGRLARFPGARIDWGELIAFERTFTDGVPERTARGFEEAGIVLLRGTPRFVSPSQLAVGDERLEAERILVATGARPRDLDFEGADLVTTSEEFLRLPELPRRILFAGGGFVSFELAHVAVRAGAAVEIVERGERPLTGFDPDLVDRLVERTRELGVQVHVERRLTGIVAEGGALTARFADGDTAAVDAVVHGAGRVPALDGLDLERGEVEADDGGVVVDELLRSPSNPRVLAAGDCASTGTPALSPAASAHATAIADNLTAPEGEPWRRPDVEAIPRIVFTVPALAATGLDATGAGPDIEVREGDMSEWSSVRKVGEPCAAYKLLVRRGDGRLLGAHLVGPGAEETINLLALAIRAGLTADRLASTPFGFPTFAADVRSMV